jgi:predicted amidohydrolase
MRAGWIQTLPAFGEPAANLAAVAAVIDEAVAAGRAADLWVLPELFATGYVFADRDEARRLCESVPDGPTVSGLIALAGRAGCAFVAGVAERSPDGRLFNAAVAVDGTGLRARYRKAHVFGDERRWSSPGDLPFPVVDLAGARVGIMICFDWRFPETARTLALAGAQIIAHPSNLVLPHCPDAMVTRALENGVFTVTCDRVGTEERAGMRAAFIGRSRVIGPDGVVLSEGPSDRPAWDVVEFDPTRADDKRLAGGNDILADRRTDLYRL